MSRAKIVIIVMSIVVSLGLIGGALVVSQQRKEQPANQTNSQGTESQKKPPRVVTREELADATGKDGKKCYVAVDGLVYEIKDFSLWQNGEHTTSNGQAYCGADLSDVIDKAPHGRKMLDILIKVGPL